MRTIKRAAGSRTGSAQRRTGRFPKAHSAPRHISHREKAQSVRDASAGKTQAVYKAGQAVIQVEENGFNFAFKIARPVVNIFERMVRFVIGSPRAAATAPPGHVRINVPSQRA
jgi:hypothetical protein